MKKIIFLLGIVLTMGCSSPNLTQGDNQDTSADKEAKIASLINEQRYIFQAQTVLPMRGRSRPLTSGYDLSIKTDTVIAYLPYFGRAYSAPLDPWSGGIRFTSTSFEYSAIDRKKGGWDILIKPADAPGVDQLRLTVSASGYGSLQVTSTNRQPISFNGYVDEWKKQ